MRRSELLIASSKRFADLDKVKRLLRQWFEVLQIDPKKALLQSLQTKTPDLILFDPCGSNDCDDLQIIEEIREQNRKIPIIILTEESSEDLILHALRLGVSDFFKSPFPYEEIITSVKKALANGSAQFSEGQSGDILYSNGHQPIIGESSEIIELKGYLKKVAVTDSTVLITGETGTGKELVADMIHHNSSRCDKPFISVNCAAIPENLIESELFGYERGAFTGAVNSQPGKFEQAYGGTIFLDEIGDMDSYAQAKILKVIEEKEVYRLGGKKAKPVDARVVAATNQELEQLVTEGRFRSDLFYRLNVARINLPPLRNRKEDLPLLLGHYIGVMNNQFGREVKGFTEQAINTLLHYNWPGNIRELKNLVEATFINLPVHHLDFVDLPKSFQKQLELTADAVDSERDRMLTALFETNWNKSQAAQKLHWSRMTLYRKMAKYHIDPTSRS